MNTAAIQQASNPNSASPSSNAGNGVPDSQSLNLMFLQLLVAQLKNQSPLNPMDPAQFVGQLAQFSELSEVTSIYQLLQQALPGLGDSGSAAANPVASHTTSPDAPASKNQGGV